MDRKMYQRVALLAGLLFLLLALEGVFAYQMIEAERMHQQEILGNQVTQHPSLESELVKSFYGKDQEGNRLTEEEKSAYQQSGQKITEQYGYVSGYSKKAMGYLWGMGIVLLAGVVCTILWFIVEKRRQAKITLESEQRKQSMEELEVRFEKVTGQLAREEQETKALITDISHQLKTPIASLKMGYEIAQTTELSEEEKVNFEQKGYEEVQRLERLLESLLNLSKLEAKLIELNPSECSLQKILTKAAGTVYMKAFDRTIEIALEEFTDQMVYVDEKWTGEAFVNLLDNAIKYSPENSEVAIRAHVLSSYLMVEVKDQGIGITANEVNDIFKRFYRGSSLLVRNQEGSGVGLYLTRKIIEEQGGTVSVKAGYPNGSIFRVTLPMKAVL